MPIKKQNPSITKHCYKLGARTLLGRLFLEKMNKVQDWSAWPACAGPESHLLPLQRVEAHKCNVKQKACFFPKISKAFKEARCPLHTGQLTHLNMLLLCLPITKLVFICCCFLCQCLSCCFGSSRKHKMALLNQH